MSSAAGVNPFPTFLIADAVLHRWLFFITLVLVFTIAIRKSRGLWSSTPDDSPPVAGAQPIYVYAVPPGGQVPFNEQQPTAAYIEQPMLVMADQQQLWQQQQHPTQLPCPTQQQWPVSPEDQYADRAHEVES